MPKPNARTFRYSDEVKLILEQYDNDFDRLIIESHLMLPAIRKELEQSHNSVKELEQQCSDLYNEIRKLTGLKYSIDYLQNQIINLGKKI